MPLEASYCPQCGQKNIDLERPFFELLRELLVETIDIDGRAARSILTMFTHPGVLTERFLAGHRKLYTPPVRLYLVVSVLFFVVMAWVVRQGILFNVNANSAGEVRVLAEDLPTLMFIFLPAFALLLKTAFRQRFYFDHLIHALHLHTAAYVVLALVLPLERAANQHWYWLALQSILIAYLAGYLLVSLRYVYGSTWVATLVKAAAVFFGYTMIMGVSLEFASTLDL
jgi:hypothetical protein